VRALAISLAASAALGAAILWAPLPAAVFGPEAPVAPVRPMATAPAPAGTIQPSRAAALIQFAPPPEAAAAAKPDPPVLVGVVGSGPRRIAYVTYGGQTVRAGLWDKVGPWRVTAIGPHGATLAGGGKRMALAFFGPHPLPAPPPAAGPSPDDEGGPPPAPPTPPPTARASAPVMHTPEPASAPHPPGGRRYWVGPPGSAPPGYIVLKPGQAPPR
jgi:hypothetical protein